MLEARSPLGAAAHFDLPGITLREAAGFTLTQLAGEEKALKKACGKLPAFGKADVQEAATSFRIAPSQVWVVGAAPGKLAGLHVTPLSSGRTRIALEGARARALLAACAAVDFALESFAPGQVAMTGFHHTPVLIHCTGEDTFHIYAMRSFAHSVWGWLVDAAQGL